MVRVRALTLTLTALHLAVRHDVESLGLVAHRVDHLVRVRTRVRVRLRLRVRVELGLGLV